MALYAVGRSTTRNVDITVFVLGGAPRVRGKVTVPNGEIESQVNPVSAEQIGSKASLASPSF